ncbi:hypothetical protein BDM02DRAFT_3184899 [Thelephora ganbajun]|uniref:Uncharacterized protein n=1 Tax=Thelephora ganbajun TaxID=370292 RepID=A0ACB6ZMV6_THEGA|nr:hypothetical protein BDM02DRAFT_3184899 [Thelephora ganbajun]
MPIPRSPYTGPSTKLVLAFDIGTTYSGVSYALLDPGIVPEIKSVGRFLDNRTIGNFKISSVLFYDHDGSFRGVKGTIDDDEAEDLHQVRWWKLKLSPGELPATVKKHMTAELPKGKSLQDVFTDFIRYLFDSAKAFIQECEPVGKELWESLESNIDLILSHPNGWEGREQGFLRKSVVQASIFTEEEALSRVSFVTEGEATFNFCVTNTKSGESLNPGHKVLIVDAGGGTIDISSYTVNSTSPLEVEEFQEPKCFYQGGEVVTARAREYAEGRLKNSKFDNKQDLAGLAESFDTGLKTTFSDSSKTQYVKFGSLRDNDTRCGVKAGKLSFLGDQVAKFFGPSVNAVVEGIKGVTAETDTANTFVFLAGGFGASPWIFQEVGRVIAAQGLKLSRPDTQTNKAVADGAVSYYLDHFVVGRIVRYTYGTQGSTGFNPLNPEHRRRAHKRYLGIIGEIQLDVFSPTLFKGTRVSGTQEFRKKVAGISLTPPVAIELLKFPVIRYTGKLKEPQWMDEEEDKFQTMAHISVDATKAPYITGMSLLGFPIFIQEFEVIYIYGQTEFKAQLAWMEDDVEKRSDVAVLYDDD